MVITLSYTQEELAKLAELNAKRKEILDEYNTYTLTAENKVKANAALMLYNEYNAQAHKIDSEVRHRAVQELIKSATDISDTLEYSLKPCTKVMFQNQVKYFRNTFLKIQEEFKADIDAGKYKGKALEKAMSAYQNNRAVLKERYSYNALTAYWHLTVIADIPLTAASIYDETNEGADMLGKCLTYVASIATEWYKPPKGGISALITHKWQTDEIAFFAPNTYTLTDTDTEEPYKEEPEEGKQAALIAPKTILPKQQIIPHDIVTNEIYSPTGLPIGIPQRLTFSRKANKRIETQVLINPEETSGITIKGNYKLSEYSRSVQNAVCSLWVYGNKEHIFTERTIYRVMNNLTENEVVSEAQVKAIAKELRKGNKTDVEIDYSAELAAMGANHNGKPLKGTLKTHLLDFDILETASEEGKVNLYRLLKEPALLTHANISGQIWTVPQALFDIKETKQTGTQYTIGTRSIANSENRIAIKNYLLRRILAMKSGTGIHNKAINLAGYTKDGEQHAGLYQAAGYANPSKAEAKRIRDYAEAVLRFYTAYGFIKGYKFKLKSKAITGIEINL